LSAGLSQHRVAVAAGISRSALERLELGQSPNLTLVVGVRVAAAVGLDLVVRTYPGGRHLRDAGQIRLMTRLRARMGPGWRWRFELPLPGPTDQRAWDAAATHAATGASVVIEAETRIRDAQEVLRRIGGKRRDAGTPRVILLVADTRSNRAALHEAEAAFRAEFGLTTRAALMALSAGNAPDQDALVVL